MNQVGETARQVLADNGLVPNPRWKELYRLGGIFCIVLLGLMVAGVSAYFIWPYQPGNASTEEIFHMLRTDLLGCLFSLDLVMLVTVPLTIILYLALYVALKQVNESYALIALVLALVTMPMLMMSRPLAELVFLSGRFAASTSEAARSQYLGAGEALISLSNGTGWIAYSILSNVSTLISSVLMLHSRFFRKGTAYTGIVLSISGACIVLPVIGLPLGLAATIASPVWFILMAGDFFRMYRQGVEKAP